MKTTFALIAIVLFSSRQAHATNCEEAVRSYGEALRAMGVVEGLNSTIYQLTDDLNKRFPKDRDVIAYVRQHAGNKEQSDADDAKSRATAEQVLQTLLQYCIRQ